MQLRQPEHARNSSLQHAMHVFAPWLNFSGIARAETGWNDVFQSTGRMWHGECQSSVVLAITIRHADCHVPEAAPFSQQRRTLRSTARPAQLSSSPRRQASFAPVLLRSGHVRAGSLCKAAPHLGPVDHPPHLLQVVGAGVLVLQGMNAGALAVGACSNACNTREARRLRVG